MENIIEKALELAHRSHLGQYRKHSGAPYIIHPLEVTKRLGRWGITKVDFPVVWCVALLHDVIEDTTTTLDAINEACGLTVANIVQELTCVKSVESKQKYLESFASKSIEALAIKVADRLCNVKDFHYDDPKYALRYFNQGKPIFDAMLDRKAELESFYGKDVVHKMFSDWGLMLYELESSIKDIL